MIKCYCDICGKESNHIKEVRLCISVNGYYKNQKTFELCDCCEEKLEELKNKTEVDFVKKSRWWENNSDESNEINYGSFEMVGSFDQGGYMCLKCGYSNNGYTFDGKCQKCGYKNRK